MDQSFACFPRPMKVIITPHGGDTNPYQKLLASSLEAFGLKVQLARSSHRFFRLWGLVLENGWPDVIHLQWHHKFFKGRSLPWAVLRTALFYLQWLTLRLLGVRFVWTVHNVVNHEEYQAGWELLACRLLARVVDGVIVHCAAAVPTIAAAYRVAPERLRIVPIGHYADWYSPASPKEEARRMLRLAADARIILFFGQVRSYKGLDRLLETFATLEAENVRLILLGEPKPASLGRSLSAQAAMDPRVVTCFEFIDNDRLINYLNACDLVVLPYEDSLTSSAAVLAASYGRPPLMPRLGCMSEFPPEAAILYDPEMRDGLRIALKYALSAPLEEMGAAAKRYIEQFPWSLVAARTLAVYCAALAHRWHADTRQSPETP